MGGCEVGFEGIRGTSRLWWEIGRVGGLEGLGEQTQFMGGLKDWGQMGSVRETGGQARSVGSWWDTEGSWGLSGG